MQPVRTGPPVPERRAPQPGEVADLLGFADQSNLFRACRRWFGMPPGNTAPSYPPRASRSTPGIALHTTCLAPCGNGPMNQPEDRPEQADCGLTWRNRFASLGPAFHTSLQPTPLPAPIGLPPARGWRELGLAADWLQSTAALHALSGNIPLKGSAPWPACTAATSSASGPGNGRWARHPARCGQKPRWGRWRFSSKAAVSPLFAHGDGRAVLRSSIREYLCSEAMHALGIPTTRPVHWVRPNPCAAKPWRRPPWSPRCAQLHPVRALPSISPHAGN